MTGKNDGFRRISVTSAEEDEVIIAGRGAAAAPPLLVSEPAGEPSAVLVDSGAGGVPVPEMKREAAPSSRRSASRRAADGWDGAYREPSLEDLEPAPMPVAQKIVVIAAVVCIIGALIYYFIAMR